MKSYSIVILFLIFLSASTVTGQEKIRMRKNSVNITLGGTGLGFSANYSRVLFTGKSYFVNIAAGLGVIPSVSGPTIPHEIKLNIRKGKGFWEMGIGGVYWSGKTDSSGYSESADSYHLTTIFGYRRNFKNHLVFRLYASPLFHISGEYFINDYSFIPYAGLSLGYAF